MAKIISLKLLFTSEFSNCENDTDEYITVDWEAVLNDETNSQPCESESFINDFSELNDEDGLILDDSTNLTQNLCTSDIAVKYFAGYCYRKLMNTLKTPCEECTNAMVDTSSSVKLSNILIEMKQYSNCPDDKKLIRPSDLFFQICLNQVNIFWKLFKEKPTLKNFKSIILDKCIEDTNMKYPEWFDQNHQCYNHHLKILDFMLLVLIRKNCKWTIDLHRSQKLTKQRKNQTKLRAVMNM